MIEKISIGMKAVLLAIAASFLIALTPAAGTEAEAYETTLGIDVSSYQGTIDWQAVANSGVKFAMIRVGNVKYGLDSNFTTNVIGANAAGIRVGVYCYSYALNTAEAAADAQLVVQACAGLPISFPVAIDIEDSSQQSLSTAEQQAIVNTFCSIVYAAGYTPMVYSYRSWFETRLGATAWDQWVANYSTSIGYTGTIWQYTSSGTVSGISSNVDMNYCLKDYYTLIPANGFSEQGGATYYFVNYQKQFGMQTIGDQVYYFDTTTGAMVKNQTTIDEAGNIIRYCSDGHVVIITAEMQTAAAQALANAQEQAALLVQYQTMQAAYEQQAAEALNQYTALQAAADEFLTIYNTAAVNWMTLPTEENLAAMTAAQAQYEQYSAAASTALTEYQTAQLTAEQAAVSTATQEVVAAQAQADSDTAQLTIVIPE